MDFTLNSIWTSIGDAMAKAEIYLKESQKVKTSDEAARRNHFMNRQHSRGFQFTKSGLGRNASRLQWTAAAALGVTVEAQRAHVATFSSSSNAPTVDATDILNLGAPTGYEMLQPE